MKKKLLISAALFTAMVIGHAQQPDTALVLVHYKFTHIQDTTDRANPYTENMALYIGKNASCYLSYDRVVYDAQFKKQVDGLFANSPDGQINVNRRGVGTPTEYYQYPNKKAMVRREWDFNNYVVQDTLPRMVWLISSDTAMFGGLHCQKATTHFKGRDYTAWFCPDLPLHVGPWKLNGLPGVIVEANDAKKEVVFKFDGTEKAVDSANGNGKSRANEMFSDMEGDPNIIQPPANAIKTTETEYAKLKVAMKKNPQAFANMAAANAPTPRKADIVVGKVLPGGPVTNNPIELPETGNK